MLSPRDGQPYGATEQVYDALRDGEKLYASPQASVASRGNVSLFESVLGFLFGGSRENGAAATDRVVRVSRVTSRPLEPGVRRVRQVGSPSAPKIVQRNTQAFWEERGWRRRGGELLGWYRTSRGSFEGRIENPGSDEPKLYIKDPPPAVLSGPHGACFRDRKDNWYWIHMDPRAREANAGIRAVERVIGESLS